MPQMRSRGRAESAGAATLPAADAAFSDAAVAGTEPQAQLDPEASDRSVVLWDEVQAPENVENKPIAKDPSEDPAAH